MYEKALQSARGSSERGSLPLHHNSPLLVSPPLQTDFNVAFLPEAGKLFAPLQQHQVAVFDEEFIEAERVEFAGGVQAIEINVEQIHLAAAEFVDEGEGGAGDVVLRCGLKAFGDALHQRGLARAEIAAQDDHAHVFQYGR